MSVTFICADVMEGLAKIDANSVDCVLTSPPYWGVRDYGTGEWIGGDPACDHRSPTMQKGRKEKRAVLPGSVATNAAQLRLAHNSRCGKCGAAKFDLQIGLEPTYQDHIETMVGVFAEIHRVLKPDGTCWMNYGDCYATSPNGRSAADTKAAGKDDRTFRDKPFSTIQGKLKAKDLCMIPNRVAIALQEWGWYVRSEIIWHKSNPMPDSAQDRPTSAHEKIFMLAKSERYYYNAQAVREYPESAKKPPKRLKIPGAWDIEPGAHGTINRQGRTSAKYQANSNAPRRDNARRAKPGSFSNDKAARPNEGHNLRNVWTLPTEPFSGAHFATMPTAIATKCLLAGCKAGGLVLDPFGGAGTTGMVADWLGLNAVLIELNAENIAMAEARIARDRCTRGDGTMADFTATKMDLTPMEQLALGLAA